MIIFVEWMKELCNHKIEFLFDQNVNYTESFEEFEKFIFDSDAIIIFFTPHYKSRCLEEGNTGVSKEYRKILNILEENQLLQSKKHDEYIKKRKMIYSILYRGKFSNSITIEFAEYRYLDISGVSKITENKNCVLTLSTIFVNSYGIKIKEILKEIITSSIEKTDEYLLEYDNMLKNLFIDTKGEYVNLPDELFIKTDAYNRIIKQHKYLLIGRKGSGKTTVKKTISKIVSNKYKGIISIIADQFSVNETYELLFKNEKIDSDIENNLSKIESYRMIWFAFINIYCIFVVYREYLKNNLSNDEQIKRITKLEEIILNIFGDENNVLSNNDEDITKAIYFYALTNLENYIETIINNSRNSIKYYKTDIKYSYTPEKYLDFLIGAETCNDFHYILRFCNKKIFIALDGFDTKFEIFKVTTVQISDIEEKKQRNEFENIWLMAFVETLMDLKYNSKLSNIIDLCLTLPVDRIESIKNNNRDFYKYHAYTVAINWTGSDLVQLITLRLKYLNKEKKEDIGTLGDDLDCIMRKLYPHIPSKIHMERNGNISMPLFLYVLRKSFWRPRDIIRYYSCILTLNKNQKNLDNISIKRAIKDEAIKIIQDEFLGEFQNLYTNLKEIVNLFISKKQILSYNEIYDVLKSAPLIINGSVAENDFHKKIKILYVIGFLGINPPESYINSQYLYDKYAFIFTEGTSMLRILKSEIRNQCKFVIHPIFTEYLFLNVDYDNLVCNYTWEYVNNIDCNNIDYTLYED